jgi:hypothetical protein
MNKTFLTGEVKAVEDGNPNGSFEVILSAPTLDRDGEVIDTGAFEPLPKHITFDIDHGLSTATTVGSGEPRYEDGVLKVSGTFSSIPRAQEVRTLVNEGHIRTTSVAFMAPKREVKDGVPHIVSAEILNGAFVPVPSNRESVVLAAKSHREAAMPGLKAIEGSFEERRENISEAVRALYADARWTYIIATFDDHVVVEVETAIGVDRYEITYTIDGEDVTLGDATPVDVVEVVQPKSEDADDTKIPDAAPEDAAPAAIPPAPSATAMAHALTAEAEVLLID